LIIKGFNIKEINLKYFVGINQIKMNSGKFIDSNLINNESEAVNRFFKIIDEIQDKTENSVIQFIKDKYILNQDHYFDLVPSQIQKEHWVEVRHRDQQTL